MIFEPWTDAATDNLQALDELSRLVGDSIRNTLEFNYLAFVPLLRNEHCLAKSLFHPFPNPDPLSRAVIDHFPGLLAGSDELGWIPSRESPLISSCQNLTPDALRNTRLYQQLLKPFDTEHILLASSWVDESLTAITCLGRTRDQGPFGPMLVDWFRRFVTGLDRALADYLRTHGAPVPVSGFSACLEEHVPTPVAVFDQEGQLLWLSRSCAERLQLHSVRLNSTLVISDETPLLKQLRMAVHNTANREPDAHPDALSETDSSFQLIPCRPACDQAGTFWLVMLNDRPSSTSRMDKVALQNRGLTSREIDVARLAAQGISLFNIAQELSIQESTVHTHLKRLYRKLGVSNRAELTYRLLTSD